MSTDHLNINRNHLADALPWRRALLWLLLLGPFFFLTYGFANWLATQRAEVGSIVFSWEHHIPFVAWTIVPYWFIDAMYGLSLFMCTTRHELNTHAKRLLTAQIIAVICFCLFPLGFSFERPPTTGVFGWMFDTLSSFDKPYNQAPSLHITLLIILWVLYARRLPRLWQRPLHILCALIGISVLTTYQHHFIDIPAGLLLGWFCVWLWPDKGPSPIKHLHLTRDKKRCRLAAYYILGAVLCGLLAFQIRATALWLIWPSVSLLMVACFYLLLGSHGFQKQSNGKMSVAAQWLLWPYLMGAKINSRLWTRSVPKADHIMDGVWLGRIPSRQELGTNDYQAVIDLTAEFSAPGVTMPWHAVPSLDLVAPSETTLAAATKLIEQFKGQGPVLVSCALGYSRSAMAIVTWLVSTQRSKDIDGAIEHVKKARPAIVLKKTEQHVIDAAIQLVARGNRP